MITLKDAISMCEKKEPDCVVNTVKDLGNHYGVSMGEKGSKYSGSLVFAVNKQTGEIEVGNRRMSPKGSVPYLYGIVVYSR